MDGSGSRRFEKNSLGRCLCCLHSLEAQTLWGKWIPVRIHRDADICGVSKLYPLFIHSYKRRKGKEEKTEAQGKRLISLWHNKYSLSLGDSYSHRGPGLVNLFFQY